MANLPDLARYEPAFATLGIHFFTGTGAPTVSASKGSLYIRLDGSGTTDRVYVNTDGSTTWTYLTAGA